MCGPAVRLETARVATPDGFKGPVPSVAAPSLNVTVPAFGVVGPFVFDTVAVSVVLCPKVVGFAELVKLVVVSSTTTNAPVPVAVPA